MARQFLCGDETTVQTTAGKLRGFQLDGTYAFHGIKYADARRFQFPTPVEPWDGVKDALAYGYCSPMLEQDTPSNELFVPHRYWPMNEHCQYLNVWTQSLSGCARKPVMVWFHGGGFAAGSSIEQVAYEGDNMSRLGDCVVVTVNHRLNILGYLDLSPFGAQYRGSANAGNADMVAALRWVHDNIAAFGGDPENVTIFGQSGGGMKVTCLLQTPAADGLFHKGVVMSGVAGSRFPSPKTDGTEIVNALLVELGFQAGDAEKLETVPYAELAKAYKKVSPALSQAGKYVGGSPVADDYYLGDPAQVGFRDHAKTIPLMVGTVMCEFAFGPGLPDSDEAETLSMLRERYGQQTDAVVASYRETFAGKSLRHLPAVDTMFRPATSAYIARRAQTCQAPTYSYLFAFDFPLEDGKPAWHCSDIPFVFHNTERCAVCNVPGVSDRLEEQVFRACMSFAHYGDPNHPGIPHWEPSKPGDECTMLFDRVCEARHNFDHKFQTLMQELGQNHGPSGKVEH